MKIETYYQMITDTWRMMKRYAGIDKDDDERWKALVKEAGQLNERYGFNTFIMRLTMLIMETLEDDAKKEG